MWAATPLTGPPVTARAPDEHGRGGHEQPEQESTGVTHEDPGRMEIVGEEADADATGDDGDERTDVVGGQGAQVLEVEPVDGQGARGDGHHPGGQSVKTVDQVDGVGDGDDPQGGEQRGPLGRQQDGAGQGDLELEPGHAHEIEDGGGQYLAGHLGRRRHLP